MITCGSVRLKYSLIRVNPILTSKWKIVCIQVRWCYTKTLKCPFILQWLHVLAVILLLALVYSLFLWRLISFFLFSNPLNNFWKANPIPEYNLPPSLHQNTSAFSWKIWLNRCCVASKSHKAFNGAHSRPHSGYITSVFSPLLEVY